ncbi:unnamed protein product [Eruca vesicaria subsp. sativa]|uniref:Uncharacterized protein n=1 Tax=Eruca vesicaria subsp. sativa TaxID=29727 RepID=A0ABC8L3R5_ERUVS|nr:unnamed protein product [Eruca vesicaria subsp. sativa]
MIFLFAFLALVASRPGASTPTPPNPSDSTPSGSMTPRDSESLDNSPPPIHSNTGPSSPAHPTQPGHDSNPIPQPYFGHPFTPSPVTQSQNNVSSSSSAHPSPTQPRQNDDRLPSRYFRNPFSQSNSNPLIPVFQRPSQSTTGAPWYHGNAFYAVERASHGIPPSEFHVMDHLSSSVMYYVFDWGINFTSQRPNLNLSIYIQAFLIQGALSLFLLANAVFPRTHPVLAFGLDRLSFVLVVITAYLASLPPIFPPYVAIIPFLVVIVFYMFFHFRR